MTLSTGTIITLAAVAGALAALLGYYNKLYGWYKRQQAQDKDIAAIKAEQTLLTYGLLACLKGMKEQGCNGPVTEAISKIEKHINQKAHM